MNNPLPSDSADRKTYPLYRGLFQYFPRALCAVAHHSFVSNEQHNPGEDLHWAREKSKDHPDCILRHAMTGDWLEVAWRGLAQLEIVLEQEVVCPEGDYKLSPADASAPADMFSAFKNTPFAGHECKTCHHTGPEGWECTLKGDPCLVERRFTRWQPKQGDTNVK